MGPLQLEGPWVSLCLHTDTERGARAWVVPHRHPSRRLITERHSAVTASTPSAQNGLHNTAPTREIWMAPQPRAALEAGRAPRRAQRRRVWGPEANTPRRHPQPWTAGLLEADAHEPVLTEERSPQTDDSAHRQLFVAAQLNPVREEKTEVTMRTPPAQVRGQTVKQKRDSLLRFKVFSPRCPFKKGTPVMGSGGSLSSDGGNTCKETATTSPDPTHRAGRVSSAPVTRNHMRKRHTQTEGFLRRTRTALHKHPGHTQGKADKLSRLEETKEA